MSLFTFNVGFTTRRVAAEDAKFGNPILSYCRAMVSRYDCAAEVSDHIDHARCNITLIRNHEFSKYIAATMVRGMRAYNTPPISLYLTGILRDRT